MLAKIFNQMIIQCLDKLLVRSNRSKRVFVSCFLLIVLGLNGCSMIMPPSRGDEEYAPVKIEAMKPPAANAGGIYQPEHGLALFSDRRATHVGDIVTIILREQTSSSKSADTSLSKETGLSFDEANILGVPITAGAYSMDTSLAQTRDFSGGAKSDQSNRLDGSITVSVAEVLPNGLLRVQGEKWLNLNRGDEFIRVEGLIRPEDISAENSIMSTKLANARISYSGRGELADSNKVAWITRFFNSKLWPF